MLSFLRRYPVSVWPLFIVMLALLLNAGGEDVTRVLRFEHKAIANGEYWRLLSAHFVHLGWAHALLNCGGLLLVAWMQPKGEVWRWWAFYLISALCISIAMYIDGNVSSYVGASGVLHGLLILAAFLSRWLEPWRRWLIITLISGKLLWEQSPWYEDTGVGEMIGGYVVVDAHFIGGLVGLLMVVAILIKKHVKSVI
jgi:rhomboid family GlyGly-CTERM serine protease